MVATETLLSALRKGAERRRRTLVSVTVESEIGDPCAAVFASRLASDRWFCWEQPDRGFALAGLGVAHEAASRGEARFRDIAAEALRTGRDAVVDQPPRLPAGAGPAWLGGFAFDPEGGASSTWSSLPPGSLVLPEISICRSGGESFLTVNALVSPGEDVENRAVELEARLAGLRDVPLPMVDPHPSAQPEIRSALPPAEFEAAVSAATARIGEGEMTKVVLARE
ncbi:MAG: isochorismate synthase, partial [Solirubrobacterales bacterium]